MAQKRPFLPQNMFSWADIGLAGSFGALLAGWLVVVARGLYLARHLFTLFKFDCFLKGLQQLFLFYELVLIKNSNSVSIVPFFRGLPEECLHVRSPSDYLSSTLGTDARVQSGPGDLCNVKTFRPSLVSIW